MDTLLWVALIVLIFVLLGGGVLYKVISFLIGIVIFLVLLALIVWIVRRL